MAALASARVGESGDTPASPATIGDLLSKNERPRALGIFAIATYLGVSSAIASMPATDLYVTYITDDLARIRPETG